MSKRERFQAAITLLVILALIADILLSMRREPDLVNEPEEPASLPSRVRANLSECSRILRRINDKEAPDVS